MYEVRIEIENPQERVIEKLHMMSIILDAGKNVDYEAAKAIASEILEVVQIIQRQPVERT